MLALHSTTSFATAAARPVHPADNASRMRSAEPALSREIQDHLGAELRARSAGELDQPLPGWLLVLLSRLARHGAADQA
jgi:hypothetical protein